MKKHILITAFLVALVLLLSSCQTVLSIPYNQPSNINMSSYRSVAVADASTYRDYTPLSSTVKYSSYPLDPRILYYDFVTLDDDRYVGEMSASKLTDMVYSVFGGSSYYSTLSREKTSSIFDSYYRLGKDPSALLSAEGVDALIIPKITSVKTNEYIDAKIVKDYRGIESTVYTLYRTASVSFTLTVLDTANNRIVTVREYSSTETDWGTFDPNNYYYGALSLVKSVSELVSRAISDRIYDIESDFIPTRRYTDVTLKDNSPKLESVEEAYRAAENGNLDYALTLFRTAYENNGHVPSGYNAALILACDGDLESAISILSDIRTKGKDDSEVDYLYSKLLSLKQKNEETQKQFEVKTDDSSAYVSPYEYLL